MTHILVIENERDHVYLLTRMLRAAGYTVSVAYDGVAGIALAQQQQPDLILLDLALPLMNGWQVLEVLSGLPVTSKIPVLITTAMPLSHVQQQIQTLQPNGPVGCVQKPWLLDELLLALRSLLASSRQRPLSDQAHVPASALLQLAVGAYS